MPLPETTLGAQAFGRLQRFFFEASGITLAAHKQALVEGRLRKRLSHHGMEDFDRYCDLLLSPGSAEERQRAVDLLTTNETYFFREPDHFTRLAEDILPELTRRPVRVWSAACSSGEECYSLAMLLDDVLADERWELIGCDLSATMVRHAQRGLYRLQRLERLPSRYLKRYCRRGTGPYQGHLLIDRALRQRARFLRHNLFDEAPELGRFDIVFLRNVLIYFDAEGKRAIVRRVIERMNPGGWLFIGLSESLQGLGLPLRRVESSIYRLVR
ncbi:CheR family methyltransferase [Niveibacterium terrae]|uniref:CheR family methyltransferase n=1 Tax=Niveibacterium terrae TaxID=3373598 RepID=UPI003A954B24